MKTAIMFSGERFLEKSIQRNLVFILEMKLLSNLKKKLNKDQDANSNHLFKQLRSVGTPL